MLDVAVHGVRGVSRENLVAQEYRGDTRFQLGQAHGDAVVGGERDCLAERSRALRVDEVDSGAVQDDGAQLRAGVQQGAYSVGKRVRRGEEQAAVETQYGDVSCALGGRVDPLAEGAF